MHIGDDVEGGRVVESGDERQEPRGAPEPGEGVDLAVELAVPGGASFLLLYGVEAVLIGITVTVDRAASAGSDGSHDVDVRWIEGKREVLLLCGGNSLGGNFDDLESGHVEAGGDHEIHQEEWGDRGKQGQEHVGEQV